MVQKSDGMNYAPVGKSERVVEAGEFKFAAVALDHGHINGMCNGLTESGAELKWIYDPDADKAAALKAKHPAATIADNLDQVLQDEQIKLVAAAAVPSERGPLGCKVMQHGKDYFTDKTPFTRRDQLEDAKRVVADTGKKYMVYYSERLHVEGAVYAGQLIKDGAIGRVVQVMGLGPHRLAKHTRPDWFFDFSKYGGILCDIGSHQIEQFLYYADVKAATVVHSKVGNFNCPEHPELEDFGDATLIGDNGATNYFRVDWFTPDGLSTWGDGRLIVIGTDGYLEVRKYLDVARSSAGDQVYLVNKEGEHHIEASGTVGFPYFGQLVLDCLNRTENAMTQDHAFLAADLCLEAQEKAQRIQVASQ
jgi:predicted dehydrogenase